MWQGIIALLLFLAWGNLSATNNAIFSSGSIEEKSKQSPFKQKIFRGKPISLNFQDIKVSAVLQLLADFTGINLVVSDKVTGNITLRLNDIPWDQALDIILTTRSLGKRKVGDVLLIVPVEEMSELKKKKIIAESKYASNLPLRNDLLQINYAKADEIANLLNEQLSNRGSVSADPRTNTIWIQDMDARIQKIKKIVHRLDVPARQVLIEARIVNANKDFARDLGIRFGLTKPTHLVGRLQDAKELAQHEGAARPLAERLNLDLAALPLATSPASIGIALAKLGDGILLDLELSALESEGKGEVVSSPRLMTANQQAALIESGEEIPYQEATLSGATAVAFKKAVLSLKVTPQITPDGKVQMDLHINQDIPSLKIFNGVPSILTKEIQTRVLVNNGQTIVLGGIYKQDKYNAINRVPFLGELPIVGALFRNSTTMIRNEELLIFITPRIMNNNLSLVAIKERKQTLGEGVELDKFGKPVGVMH